jgi:hypothetical protein
MSANTIVSQTDERAAAGPTQRLVMAGPQAAEMQADGCDHGRHSSDSLHHNGAVAVSLTKEAPGHRACGLDYEQGERVHHGGGAAVRVQNEWLQI